MSLSGFKIAFCIFKIFKVPLALVYFGVTSPDSAVSKSRLICYENFYGTKMQFECLRQADYLNSFKTWSDIAWMNYEASKSCKSMFIYSFKSSVEKLNLLRF